MTPEQIVVTSKGEMRGALVDQWGRAHALSAITELGRSIEVGGITILDVSVSRRHAWISCADGVWTIRDAGSANGTIVNHASVIERVLYHGDRIRIGSVGFYVVFHIGRGAPAAYPAVATSIEPSSRMKRISHSRARAARDAIHILEPTGGGGGIVALANASAQVTAMQLELIEMLAQRLHDEERLPAALRGFVRSSEMVSALSWEMREANDSHVKQLVRRVRRRLIRAGLGDVIESRHRFGYRLRVPSVRTSRAEIRPPALSSVH